MLGPPSIPSFPPGMATVHDANQLVYSVCLGGPPGWLAGDDDDTCRGNRDRALEKYTDELKVVQDKLEQAVQQQRRGLESAEAVLRYRAAWALLYTAVHAASEAGGATAREVMQGKWLAFKQAHPWRRLRQYIYRSDRTYG